MKSTQTCYPGPNGSPENIYRSHIIQIKQVIFRNTLTHTHRQHTYTPPCTQAITVFFFKAKNLKERRERIWREEIARENVIIISKVQLKCKKK